MALMLDNGQLRLHLVAGDQDYISRVGQNLDNGDWFYVNVMFGPGQYRLQGTSVSMVTRLILTPRDWFYVNVMFGPGQYRPHGCWK
jgi:hypothetical protein